MRIVSRKSRFETTFQNGEIFFFTTSDNIEDIETIEHAIENISKDEEEFFNTTLTKLYNISCDMTKLPYMDMLPVSANGERLLLYLNGYQIEVTTA